MRTECYQPPVSRRQFFSRLTIGFWPQLKQKA
jgi:hypothetical protein